MTGAGVIAVIIVALIVLLSCIKIVPQENAMVVERFGGYLTTWSGGIHFKLPFIDRIVRRVLLKEQALDITPQPVITKDNITLQIDASVHFQVIDPKQYTYEAVNGGTALKELTVATLRNIIGDLELDETLDAKESIGIQMRAPLDLATDSWGLKINDVEIKSIVPPKAVQDAMGSHVFF